MNNSPTVAPSSTASSQRSATVRKAMLLVDLLATHPEGLGLSAMARLASMHHATVYRLLATLSESGLVECGEAKHYRLGLRILDLAGILLESLEVREVARPVLAWLSASTHETAHLATLDRGEMVFLDRVDGPQAVTLRTRAGFRAPVHVTAVGKAFLAFSNPAVVERVLKSRTFRVYTEHTIAERSALLAHFDHVRRLGYAVDNEEHRLTIRCVGAPIFDHRKEPVAAISVAGPTFRLTPRRIRECGELVKRLAAGSRRNWAAKPRSDTLHPKCETWQPSRHVHATSLIAPQLFRTVHAEEGERNDQSIHDGPICRAKLTRSSSAGAGSSR